MYKILIAEDEALERQVLRYLLERSSLPVSVVGEASNGKEAVAMVDSLKPDIVLMDIKMPGMDGLEATKLIKEKHPDIEVVITTAYGKFSYSRQAIKCHVADYLLKPVQPDEMVNTLKEVCSRLDKKSVNTVMGLESIPLTSGMHKELVNYLLLNKVEKSKVVCNGIIDKFLSVNSDTSRRILIAFAYELMVTVLRGIINAGLSEKDVTEANKELVKALKTLASVEELRRWSDKMLDMLAIILKQNTQSNNALIKRVEHFIHDNYHKEISLIQVAAEVHLSPAYLSRIFKQKTKNSFTQYLTRYRIQEAKKLLLNTSMTIDEIACSVGYNNNSYFTSVFKRHENVTPSEFRIKEKYE